MRNRGIEEDWYTGRLAEDLAADAEDCEADAEDRPRQASEVT